ncbi:MAG: DUF3500 domain-containing protein [Pirellulales bacterium]
MSVEHTPAPADVHQGSSRRRFLQTVSSGAAAAAVGSALWNPHQLLAAPTAKSKAESAVIRLYQSMSDVQKKKLVLPFDHALRSRVNANWHVTEPLIGSDFFTKDQRVIIDEIVRGVTTEDGYARFQKQMEEDDGGIEGYSMAIFGDPDSGKIEWELTGRHLTLRADGNAVDKAAFGGPIVYGHGEENAKKNLFYYQTQQVNEVFKALDGKQAQAALVTKAPKEDAVAVQGAGKTYPGLAVSSLSADQKQLVEKSLKVLLAPYRSEDVDEVFEILKASGGLDQLHLAFYQEGDLESDKQWDIWRVEGPSLVWHFRGAPHVHAYINIAQV